MPIGVLSNALSVAIGGLLGALLRDCLSSTVKEQLNLVFGACSMAIGISSIVLMRHIPPVVLAVIVGTVLGLALQLGRRITNAAFFIQSNFSRLSPRHQDAPVNEGLTAMLVTSIVLFCASGTGVYGAIVSGMIGDHSVLIAKSMLDLFSAMIFACTLGPVVSTIAIPQCLIFLALFFCAKLIYPLTTPSMIDDFKACGGVIMLCTGFRMVKLKMFPLADMLPAMILVMPFSWLWSSFVLPLVG